MRKVRFPLLIKILLVVITIILVVGSGTAWLTFIKTKDVLLGYQKDSITKLTVEEAEEMVGNLEHSVLFTKMIAGQAKMAEYLTRPGNKNLHKELVDIFDRYQREYPEYLAVYLMDPSGKTLISSDRSFVGQDYSFREYFKQAITGKEYTEAQVGITSRQLGFYFSAPVFTFDKSKILGVVVAKLREEAISQELLGHEITKVGQVMLTNREGKIFIAQKKDRRLLDLEKIGYSEVLNKLKNYRGHIELVNFYDKADKEQELVLIARVGQTPFYLVVETVDDDLEAAVLPTAWTIGLGVLVASILALLAIMLVVVRLLSPLKQVRFFAQEFGPGNFGLRLQINSSDEIGEIATLLNKMAGEIESLYSQMEEKIKLRTSDLEKAKIALLNVMEDITREKQNLVKFEMAVAETSDHVVITDADGIILYANPAVERITGFAVSEVMGKKVGGPGLWGGLMPKKFYETLWNIIKIEKLPYSGEINNRRKNGEEYTAMASISPILSDSGEVQFFVGIERDITKEKEVDKAKTEFVSLASHQLRTPLSGINWYTEMLLAGDAGEITSEQKMFLEQIYHASRRMVDLVNALLNVSRLEMGTFVIEPQASDVESLVREEVEEAKSDFVRKGQTVALEVAKGLPPINLDQKLFQMAVQNLISNAVKYSPSKSKIVIRIDRDNDQVVVSVKDSGMGIPAGEQEKMFTKLYRATNARGSDTSGTGLGLYIIKMVMDQSGGKIWFESKEGEGSTFFLSIPFSGMVGKDGIKRLER